MILLAYHEPGYEKGRKLVVELARDVEGIVGIKPKPVTLTNLEPSGDDLVFILLPARGGHYYSVVEQCLRYGARPIGPIPPRLSAEHIARSARGCRRVSIIFREARRFRHEQKEDILEVKRILEEDYGLEVSLVPDGEKEGLDGACGAILTLTPSRLAEKYGSIVVNGLLPGARRMLASWIARTLRELGAAF